MRIRIRGEMVRSHLCHLVFRSTASNQQRHLRSTCDRDEVSGGLAEYLNSTSLLRAETSRLLLGTIESEVA